MLHVEPATLAEANALVTQWHRHHKPCRGHRFSIGVYDENGSRPRDLDVPDEGRRKQRWKLQLNAY